MSVVNDKRDIVISDSFIDDLNNTSAILNNASSNCSNCYQNISGLNDNIDVPDLQTEKVQITKTASEIKQDLNSVCTAMKSSFTDMASRFMAIVVSINSLIGTAEEIFESDSSDADKAQAIADAIDGLEALNEIMKDMTNPEVLLDSEAYKFWKAYFNGETDLDWDGFIAKLQETIELDNTLADDVKDRVIKNVTKFGQKVLNNKFKDVVESHMGVYGMTVIGAFEGLALSADIDFFSRLGEAFKIKAKSYIQSKVGDEVEAQVSESFLTKAFTKEVSGQAFLVGATLNLVISLSNDFIKQELTAKRATSDIGHALISSASGLLGVAVGSAFTPVVGFAASVAVDTVATWVYDLAHDGLWGMYEDYEHYHSFGSDDIKKILDGNGGFSGLVDDPNITPGTTVFDVSTELVKRGYPAVVASMVTGNKDLYIRDDGRLTVDAQAVKMCLQYNNYSDDSAFMIFLGVVETKLKNDGYSPEELAEFRERCLQIHEDVNNYNSIQMHITSSSGQTYVPTSTYEKIVYGANTEGEGIYDASVRDREVSQMKETMPDNFDENGAVTGTRPI